MKLKYDFDISELMSVTCAVSRQKSDNGDKVIVRLDNETAVRIFSLLQDGMDVPAIVSTMMEEYDVEETELRVAVEDFIAALVKDGILER